MANPIQRVWALACFCVIAVLGTLPSLLAADEPCEEFLNSLRDRGYFDVALDYLDEMESSSLASSRFKQLIPFERAQTLILSTRKIRDRNLLEERLGEAEKLLIASEGAAETEEQKAKAQNYQGDLLYRRARNYLSEAKNDRLTSSEKSAIYEKAQGYLQKALQTFGRAQESYRSIISDYQIDLRDPESRKRLKRLQATYTTVRVRLPQILEMYADTLEPEDSERRVNLERAAETFEQLWNKYPNFPAGLESCLLSARCHRKLGNYSDAISLLQQIFALPDNTALLAVKRRAMITASDCWAEMQPYPFDDVIANLEPYCDRLTRREERIPEWQRIRLELARAYREKAASIKVLDRSDGRIKRFEREASKLIKALARANGPHQNEARRLMTKWDLKVEAVASESSKPITTFAEAKQRGTDLMTEIEGVNSEIADLKRQQRIAVRSELAKIDDDLRQAKSSLNRLTTECLEIFEMALKLAGEEIEREDWSQIRYLQSVCYFVQNQFFESALIGEFLVNRFPTVPFSRQAGGIAIRSYASLYDVADAQSKSFEKERLGNLAQKIIDTWPGSSESNQASSMLAKLILAESNIDEGELADVRRLIDKISESSPARANLEIKLGRKLWFAFTKAKSAGTLTPDQQNEKLLDLMDLLNRGVNFFDAENLQMDAAWGALFLVNAHFENNDIDAAIRQLDAEPIAPVDFIKQKNRVVFESPQSDAFIMATYKTAGKTYLAAISKYPEDNSWADKCLSVVNAMKTRARKAGSPKLKAEVSSMYRMIAVQLEQQLAQKTDPIQQEKFIANLRRFIDTLQSESDDANTIIWSGGMLMKLGEIFVEQGRAQKAKPYFTAAITALERAEVMDVQDQAILRELKRQQAIAKRGVGKYKESIEDFVSILKENPNAWQIQMDAAQTLQVWGMGTKNSKVLAKALSGTEKYRDPKTKRQKNLIWGWSNLAQALSGSAKLKNAYYESLFNAVSTRMQYGVLEKNSKVVAAASKRLQMAKRNEPNLGGENWADRFNELEKQIDSKQKQMRKR
ncbi:MAG: hypothetical protein AAGA30_11610 [Planctomycetota bacterium]